MAQSLNSLRGTNQSSMKSNGIWWRKNMYILDVANALKPCISLRCNIYPTFPFWYRFCCFLSLCLSLGRFFQIGANSDCINIPLFLKLFDRLLESIVILKCGGCTFSAQADPSLYLNLELASSLLSGCKTIDSKIPDSISEFIAKHQTDFKEIGWKLEEKRYAYPRRGKCCEALHVSRL